MDDIALPDLTPINLDLGVRAFKSSLCCNTHPVAILIGQRACQDCLVRLKEEYTGTWELRGKL